MRIRTIKPEWLSDELLAGCSDAARMLSVALILMADDHGRGRASVPTLVGEVWRYEVGRDDGAKAGEVYAKARRALDELSSVRFATLYEVNGQAYYEIRSWAKHQKIDRKGPPRIPAPSDDLRSFDESSTNPRRTVAEASIQDQGSGTGIGDQGGEGKPPAALGPKSSTKTWSSLADVMRKAIEAGARAAQMPTPIECSEPDHRAWTECARQALQLGEAKGADPRDVMRLAAEEAVLDMPRRAWKVRHLAEDFVALVSADHIERRAKARGGIAA